MFKLTAALISAFLTIFSLIVGVVMQDPQLLAIGVVSSIITIILIYNDLE